MNPYTTPPPPPPWSPPRPRPWWRTTRALLGVLALVAVLSAVSFPLGFLMMIAAMVAVWVLPPWRWYARLGATFGAFLLTVIGAGIGGQLDDNGPSTTEAGAKNAAASASPAASKAPPLTDYKGKALDEAEKGARAAGYTLGRHDASPEDRAITVRSAWTVCFQEADAAEKAVAFAAVKDDEPCPTKDGGALPWPTMPDVVGDTYNTALKALNHAGIDTADVTLDDVYLDVDAPTTKQAAAKGAEWRVCFQRPARDSDVTSTTKVRLDLGRWTDADTVRKCPSKKNTTYKLPANDPDDHNKAPDTHATTGGSSTNGGSGTSGSTSGGGTSSSGGGSGSTGGGGSGSTGGGSSSSSGGSAGTVHPGSFCSPPGATGVSAAGTPMVCGPGSDGRNRWHSS
ncbi:PASTA domain-containing protein [Streptomyces griseoaurantiacus]|uniref:PASTA domain-containing protein n=1 Tax=Streptomyces griseoaurantiacus TaxID=68213 RepID=UPI00345F65DD